MDDQLREDLELLIRRVANQIGISEDYATVLLLAKNWNEKAVLNGWNNSDLSTTSGVVTDCHFFDRHVVCELCFTPSDCKTYGCMHHLCRSCVKGHVENQISVGNLAISCRVETCGKKMCSSRFLADVKAQSAQLYNQNLVQDYGDSLRLFSKKRILNRIVKCFVAMLRILSFGASSVWDKKYTILCCLISGLILCRFFGCTSLVSCVAQFTLLGALVTTSYYPSVIGLLIGLVVLKLLLNDHVLLAIVFGFGLALLMLLAILLLLKLVIINLFVRRLFH